MSKMGAEAGNVDMAEARGAYARPTESINPDLKALVRVLARRTAS
jgi:hypothetical protein